MTTQVQVQATHVEIDEALGALSTHKDVWARKPAGEKIHYLVEMRERTARVAASWVDAAAAAKGIPTGSPLAGEEWISGPWAVTFALNRMIDSMKAIAADGAPTIEPGKVHTRPNGQVVVDVFPQNLFDKLLVSGISAEVWMEPGVTADNLRETMAVFYKQDHPAGKVALVLGAGNIASIAPLDVLYKLYAEGQVCLLKMNPVNDYLGTFMENIFEPFVKDGFVRLAYGGVEVGTYLSGHHEVDEIHMTGSDKTHDAILYGIGDAGVARKKRDEPIMDKRITSELGAVSPTIVVPGPWSDADLAFQAEHIVTQKMHNGGFNCCASQVLITPQTWDKTPALLDEVRGILRGLAPRTPYYPGAADRRDEQETGHAHVETIDAAGKGLVPRTLILDLDPNDPQETCFRVEAFAGVLSQTALPGATPAEFLRNAVRFANEQLWGTLGANIIIHPKTVKDLGPVLDEAIADLRYGCIGVNAWTGVGFLLAPSTWGAYPGHRRDDIQSGQGVVHNTYFFDRAQKSVIRAPFYPYPRSYLHGQFTLLPRPPWFATNKQAANIGRRLVAFEAKSGWSHLPGIFFDALRG